MRLIKGNFYDDLGHIVPLEIGNREQITLLQAAEKDAEIPRIEPELSCTVSEVEYKADFRCTCGRYLEVTETKYPDKETWFGPDEEEIGEILQGEWIQCSKCGQDYIVDDDYTIMKYEDYEAMNRPKVEDKNQLKLDFDGEL